MALASPWLQQKALIAWAQVGAVDLRVAADEALQRVADEGEGLGAAQLLQLQLLAPEKRAGAALRVVG